MIVSTVDEMRYVQRMNTVLPGSVVTEDELPIFLSTDCTQCSPLWRNEHRAYGVVRTMDEPRYVLSPPVIHVDWTLSRNDRVW